MQCALGSLRTFAILIFPPSSFLPSYFLCNYVNHRPRLSGNILFRIVRLLLSSFSRDLTGKSKYEKLPCKQFLKQIEISSTFLGAKQVEEKRARFQFVVEIAHKAVVLILISL